MRRVLLLSGLLGLLVTGLVSTQAFAQENTDTEAQPAAEEQKAEQPPVEAVVAPAVPVAVPVAKPKVGDLSTHGYFRGGFGGSGKKGRMTCFQLANPEGLLSKYRLGNECEVWAEFELTSVVYAGDDGSYANLHFMPVAFIPSTYIGYSPTGVTSAELNSTSTGATVAFPNLYADIKGISWLAGGTAWAGTRYYKRESIYISDFFYWNPSGVGAGIEDYTLGKLWDTSPESIRDMTISAAVFAVDGVPNGDSGPSLPPLFSLGFRTDAQIRGFRPYQGGEFQLGFQYIADWSGKDSNGKSVTHPGWGVTFQHVQNVLGGTNKLAVQYGRGGGTGFGTLGRFYYPDFSLRWPTVDSRLRILDVLTIQPTDRIGAQVAVVFQRDDKTTRKSDWYSAGTRVSLGIVEHFKLLGEVGFDLAKKTNGADAQWLAKYTVAPTIAGAKGFWGRPELRVFFTYAMWNKDAAVATVDSGKLFTTPDSNNIYTLSGYIFGLQAEAMW